MVMTDKEFVEKAQDFLPDEIVSEISQTMHTAQLTATCEAHMLFSFVLDYGLNVLSAQVGPGVLEEKLMPAIKDMVTQVNNHHVAGVAALRKKYPEAFAAAEAQSIKSSEDQDHKKELIRSMLGESA